ncbi:8021_t:CDS:2, partial [Gigaspora rosea]
SNNVQRSDENMACNTVRALRQARERNDRAMSIVLSNSRTSSASSASGLMFTNSTQISETSSTSLHVSEFKQSKQKKKNYVLDIYVVRPLTTSQQYEFNRLLLRLIIQNGLTLRFSQEPVTIMFDSWKNVYCQEILGVVILSATNQLYIWDAEDISYQSQKTPNVLNQINAFFESASNQNLNIVAMVTDSASAYASAWLISVLVTFLNFHQNISKQNAITIALYFTDKRHSKATSLLHDEQQRIYKKIYSFVLPITTYKSQNVINDIQFWIYLEELRDAANLFDVTYAFGYIAQQYKDNTDKFGYQMQQKLEKRWADWEQPLLHLAVIFHP